MGIKSIQALRKIVTKKVNGRETQSVIDLKIQLV
jgi:hypothetical protein